MGFLEKLKRANTNKEETTCEADLYESEPYIDTDAKLIQQMN